MKKNEDSEPILGENRILENKEAFSLQAIAIALVVITALTLAILSILKI
ncbi:MAG: hypothetical protein R3A13_05950 [Bdellovibrionota bacterium]